METLTYLYQILFYRSNDLVEIEQSSLNFLNTHQLSLWDCSGYT